MKIDIGGDSNAEFHLLWIIRQLAGHPDDDFAGRNAGKTGFSIDDDEIATLAQVASVIDLRWPSKAVWVSVQTMNIDCCRLLWVERKGK